MASQSHAKDEGERVASVRLTATQHERLKLVAESEYRTISQELRRLVEQRLEEAA